MKRPLFCLLFFLLATMMAFAQTTEMECAKNFHATVDSFFVKKIGQAEYLLIRDSMELWLNLKVDPSGKLIDCKVLKNSGIDTNLMQPLQQEILKHRFLCLYEVYKRAENEREVSVNIPFVPGRYLYTSTR